MRAAAIWCGWALLAVGCGGQPPPAASPAEREAEPPDAAPPSERGEPVPESAEAESDEASSDAGDVPGLAAELSSADAAFGESLAEGLADCVSAERFRDELCRLAQRICELERSEPRSTTTSSCEDGRRRCEQAQRRFAEVCG